MRSASFSMSATPVQNPVVFSAPAVISRVKVHTADPDLASIATQLLVEFRRHCGEWPSQPHTVARSGFLPRDVTLPDAHSLPQQWKNWHIWEPAFPWREATAEESQTMMAPFSAYATGKNYIAKKWREYEGWCQTTVVAERLDRPERPVIMVAGSYFNSVVSLSVQKSDSRKNYFDRRNIANLRMRFLFDTDVYEAALRDLRAR